LIGTAAAGAARRAPHCLPRPTTCASLRKASTSAAKSASCWNRNLSGEDDARASDEFRPVVVEELGDWVWGAAGDLLEGVVV
jgi:hypothetical protein